MKTEELHILNSGNEDDENLFFSFCRRSSDIWGAAAGRADCDLLLSVCSLSPRVMAYGPDGNLYQAGKKDGLFIKCSFPEIISAFYRFMRQNRMAGYALFPGITEHSLSPALKIYTKTYCRILSENLSSPEAAAYLASAPFPSPEELVSALARAYEYREGPEDSKYLFSLALNPGGRWIESSIRADPYCLLYTENTPDRCRAAVETCKDGLLIMNSAMWTPDILAFSAEKWPVSLKYIPDFLQTADICRAAVKKDGRALSSVSKKFVTQAVCYDAVASRGSVLPSVPEVFMNFGLIRSAFSPSNPDPCRDLAAVPVKFREEKVCEAACALNYENLSKVPVQTYGICMAALENSPEAVRLVRDQKKSICMTALREAEGKNTPGRDSLMIRVYCGIENPDAECSAFAVRCDPFVFPYVNNPDEKIFSAALAAIADKNSGQSREIYEKELMDICVHLMPGKETKTRTLFAEFEKKTVREYCSAER